MPLSHQLDALETIGLSGPFGDDLLSIGHMKIYADGTLTGGTAAFSGALGIERQLASYFHEPAALRALIERAWTNGWRIGVHAQGDEAIAAVLDGFERGMRANPMPDPRPRIEHAGFPGADGVRRMRALDVIAVTQPSYLFDYGDEYHDLLGEHAHDLQPWRAFLDAGVRVVISSDSDVSSYRPLETTANAMLRQTRSGEVLGAQHRLTLEEALFAHTIDAAYAVGLDDRLGSLEPGKSADLTVLGEALRDLEPQVIGDVSVSATMLGGDIAFSAAES